MPQDGPSLEVVQRCTKEHLFEIAEHYGVEVCKQTKKCVLVQEVCAALSAGGILPAVRVAPEQAS